MLNQISLVEHFPKANRIEGILVILYFVPMSWLNKLFEIKFLFFILHEVTKICRVSRGCFSLRHFK